MRMLYEIQSDPNGTRTRVFGVKGRCPRPLDDGVTLCLLKIKEQKINPNSVINNALVFEGLSFSILLFYEHISISIYVCDFGVLTYASVLITDV